MSLGGPALVTGAFGQDGFILSRALRARGVNVVGLVRPGRGGERRAILEGQGCRLVELDLARAALLGALVADIKPGSIFHLAAAHHASGVTETDADRDAMTAVN
ncbi:MAG: NAD-dependent epimerase/dehydratase family protein, partial [Rhodospirillaceae bacterium]|nr:NAD-dependent epimerase/dehydratase family protein [Rhodospirillaceae bacterium]